MKGLLQIFLVGLLGLAFTNSIENSIPQIKLQATEKLKSNNQEDNYKNSASNQFLSVKAESPNGQEKFSQTLTSNSVTVSAPLFISSSTTENTKGQTNTTKESRLSEDKDQEQLIHSDSEESPKGKTLYPSAAGTSFKRSYANNSSIGINGIESAGSGYLDKTFGSNSNGHESHDYGYAHEEGIHHDGEEGNPHELENHHQSRPLKPSIVHRDPHDTYDHHDMSRTLDIDHIFYDKHQADYGHQQHQPYHYDGQKIPDCVQKNIYFYNLTFCLEDHHYPKDEVLWAIKQAGEHVNQLLTDVTYQSADNLIDSLTRAEEEGHMDHQPNHLEKNKALFKRSEYAEKHYTKEGYICPSDIYYGRPRRAKNTYGKWKVIVNLDSNYHHPHHGDHSSEELHHHHQYHHEILPAGSEHTGYYHAGEHYKKVHRGKMYTQTLRLEQCISPNTPCSYIDSHYHSKCIQKHNFVRLVAWTYESGLHVDTFKMPIACSCHVGQPIHYHHDHELEHNSHHNHDLLPNHQVVTHEYGHASESATVTVPKKNK